MPAYFKITAAAQLGQCCNHYSVATTHSLQYQGQQNKKHKLIKSKKEWKEGKKNWLK